MGDLKAGVFEIAQEDLPTPERLHNFIGRLQSLALESNVPTTFGVVQFRKLPHDWRAFYQCVDDTIAAGGKMLVQGTSRWISTLLSFESTLPFDRTPVWSDMRKRPLAEQEAALRNPDLRRALLDAARDYMTKPDRSVGAEARKPNFDSLFVLDKPLPPYRSIAQIARESAKDSLDVMIDLSLEKHLKQFFIQPLVNEDQDVVLAMMRPGPRAAASRRNLPLAACNAALTPDRKAGALVGGGTWPRLATVSWLAWSPASCPPMPSATAHRPRSARSR